MAVSPRTHGNEVPLLLADLARIREDLRTARDVQSRLFPGSLPRIQGLDYYGECRPAQDVGGDFYDFVTLPQKGLAISIGDVSGHGIGAGLLMSGLQALLRGLTRHAASDMLGVLREINHAVWQTSPDNFYATLFYAYVDPMRGQLRYVSAGHEPALLVRRRTGRVVRLDSTGTVLGLSERSVFAQRTVGLEPGDLLIAYTDGISDAAATAGGEFGEQGILRTVSRNRDARATDLAREILEAVETHAATTDASDDRTAVVLRYQGTAERTVFEDVLNLALAAA